MKKGVIKGRACTDRRKQRIYIPPEQRRPPTVSTKGLMMSCVLDAVEEKIVGIYLYTDMTNKVYMVIRNEIVNMLVKANPTKYENYIHKTKKGGKILYVLLKKALYGYLKRIRLFGNI